MKSIIYIGTICENWKSTVSFSESGVGFVHTNAFFHLTISSPKRLHGLLSFTAVVSRAVTSFVRLDFTTHEWYDIMCSDTNFAFIVCNRYAYRLARIAWRSIVISVVLHTLLRVLYVCNLYMIDRCTVHILCTAAAVERSLGSRKQLHIGDVVNVCIMAYAV